MKQNGIRTAAVLAIAIAAFTVGCEHAPKTEQAPDPKVEGAKVTFALNAPQLTSLTVEKAEQRKNFRLHFPGRLIWNDDLTVRIFSPVGGRVQRVTADLEKQVSAGSELAVLNSPDLGQVQADAQKATSDLALKERTLSRVQDLLHHGVGAQKDLFAAQADCESARSECQRAAARLALYAGNTNKLDSLYHLTTPLAGTVVERNISPGQEIRPDQMLANAPQFVAPLFVVSDPTKLWIQLDVTEMDIPHLHRGMPLRVHSRAFPDKVFDGTLEVIGSSLDPTTRTVKARGLIANPSRLLRAEMYVTVDFDVPVSSGVEVPSKAVFIKGEKYFVFIENSPGQYERHEVKAGSEHDGRIAVENGIVPGTRVVTDGCLLLDSLMNSES